MTTPKKDPIVTVLHFFETADLARVDQAMALVRETVRKRMAKSQAAKQAAARPNGPAAAPVKKKSNNPSGKKKQPAAEATTAPVN